MNKELKNLYLSKWPALKAELDRIDSSPEYKSKPTYPLLLFIDNEAEFSAADIRVMFFGMETNGWYEEDDELESIISGYDNFYNKERCFSYGGQFWNGVSRFMSLMTGKFPNKKIRYVWNNIVKIGKSEGKGFPPPYVYEAERKLFPVIKDELKIINPNVLLFLTGPYYDIRIEENFGKLPYKALEPFTERQLSKLSIEGYSFAFRTYHPNYLWRNDIDSYFERIIKEIKI